MTADPRDVEEIRADLARRAACSKGFGREVDDIDDRLARDVEPLLARLAAADRENAELRGEVERYQRECGQMHEDDHAKVVRLRAQLAAAQAQLTEARKDLRREQDAMATLYGGFAAAAEARDHAEAQVLIQNGYTNRAATAAGVEQQRAEAAEARIEAVRALADEAFRTRQCHVRDECEMHTMVPAAKIRAALSAAPPPEPDRRPINARFYPDVEEEPLVMVDVDDEPPASDEPARCEHGQTEAHPYVAISYHDQPIVSGYCFGPRHPECRHCGGTGNAHTFDGDDVGICGTCHGTGSAAGGGL